MAWMRFNSNTHIRSAGMQVSFDVLYPEHGVGAKGGRTLYLLHDYGENRAEWLLQGSLPEFVEKYALTVVLPEGLNSFYVNLPSAHFFSDYLCDDLPAYLEGILPLSSQREDRFIAGIGMGGYGAFRQVLNRPEVFGGGASFSGILDIRGFYGEQASLPCGKQGTTIPAGHLFGTWQELEENGNDLFLAARRLAGEKEGVAFPRLLQVCPDTDPRLEDNRRFHEEASGLGIPVAYEETGKSSRRDYLYGCLEKCIRFWQA